MFYIRQYNGEVVGNPKGYATYKGACMALNCKYRGYTKLTYYLWAVFDTAIENGWTGNRVYTIE